MANSEVLERFQRDGFDLVVSVAEDWDLSYYGEWSDSPLADERLSVDHHARAPYDRYRTYRYWNPAYQCSRDDLKTVMREWRASGETAHDAYRKVMRWRMDSYRWTTNGDLRVYVVTVTAYRHGIELGSDCLSGIDHIDDGRHGTVEETVRTVMEEYAMIDVAIDDARKTLSLLCREED